MTERPFFSESRRRRLRRIAVALVLMMVAVLLVAGCIGSDGKYIRDQDIEIIKFAPNGTVAWTKTIDYGTDEVMRDIIQTDDGNYVIAGGSAPNMTCNYYGPSGYYDNPVPRNSQLIGLSSSGEILWLRNYSYNWEGGMIAVFANHDSSLDAINRDGELWHLNPDGSEIRHRPTNLTLIAAVMRSGDQGYVVVSNQYLSNPNGLNITKLDPAGKTVWSIWFNKSQFNRISQVVELPNQQGYLFCANNYNITNLRSQILIVRLNPDGIPVNETPLMELKTPIPDYSFQPVDNGYILVIDELATNTTLVQIDINGKVISSVTYDSYHTDFLPTKDKGFISIDYPKSNSTETVIKKADLNGSSEWENTEIQKGISAWKMIRSIQTSDGGYVIMVATKKMNRC